MVLYEPNFLSIEECQQVLDLWNEADSRFVDGYVRCSSISLEKNLNVEFLEKRGLIFNSKNSFRIQKYNETYNPQPDIFHGHKERYSWVIFLNQDFTGGELVFGNGATFRPKSGGLVYFEGTDETHKVNSCIGDRFVLVGLSSVKPDFNFYQVESNKSTRII